MDASKANERRTFSRFPRDGSIRLHRATGEKDVVARVRDISISGMGLLTQHQVGTGTWLVVEPADSKHYFSPQLRAEVQHLTKADSEGYQIGCRFDRLLTIEDMEAFG